MSSALLAVIGHYNGPDRDKALDWYRWLTFNYLGGIPDEIDGETLAMMPRDLREQIELFYEKAASERKQ